MKQQFTDSSGGGEVLQYRGRISVRPIGRGVVLEDLEPKAHLDDILDPGDYEAEIRIERKLPTKPTALPDRTDLQWWEDRPDLGTGGISKPKP